jgi:hypothetical protein
MIRFNNTLLLEGCVMLTLACAPTLKLCQLMAALSVFCVIAKTELDGAILADPAVTCPPTGNCVGETDWATAAVPAMKARAMAVENALGLTHKGAQAGAHKREPWQPLPDDLAISATATKACAVLLHNTR